MKIYPPRKKDWTPGTYQVGLFVRTARGSIMQTVLDQTTEAKVLKLVTILNEPEPESNVVIDEPETESSDENAI